MSALNHRFSVKPRLYSLNGQKIKNLVLTCATFSVFALQAAEVSLVWDSVEGATTYKLVRADGSIAQNNSFDTAFFIDNGQSYVDSSIEDGKTYTYKVIGCVYNPTDLTTLCETVAEFSNSLEVLGGADTAVTLTYQYDALGRLIKVIDPYNGDRDYEYDAAGNRKSVVATGVNQ
ncbi:RHS repeat protein [Aliiglaciecola sp. CAU 1673]|uniref:RHS repeat domain-containing protein n=1 Tax=Aliiglaciecola sp. CAU 1673 TaxID=3032595 RepID=UPI0023DA6EE0|nr:RHS repeat domain-containing protein [Aliiglaciecola sp. CAU 1673]MDF2176839.1 RHS repeat protein [Aliiglaciecola sp. CAU 1673]